MRRVGGIVVTCCVFFASSVHAQSYADTAQRPTGEFVRALLGIGAYVIVIPAHEFGHFLAASAAGAHPYMDFTPFKYGPGAIAATVFEDTGMTRTELGITALAGVTASRLVAEGANWAGLSLATPSKYSRPSEQFLSMMYLIGRFDFPAYVLHDAISNLEDVPGSDMDILVTQIAGHNTGNRTLTYLGLLALGTFDVIMDLPRISYHFFTAEGRRADPTKARWGSRLSLGADRNGVRLNYSAPW